MCRDNEKITKHHWKPKSRGGAYEGVLYLNWRDHSALHRIFVNMIRDEAKFFVHFLATSTSWTIEEISDLRSKLIGSDKEIPEYFYDGPLHVEQWPEKFQENWRQLFGDMPLPAVYAFLDIFMGPPEGKRGRTVWTIYEVDRLRVKLKKTCKRAKKEKRRKKKKRRNRKRSRQLHYRRKRFIA